MNNPPTHKPIRIILTGAQCTGKTSVMNQLPENLKEMGIREVIRNLTAQDPTIHINGRGDEWSQNRFFFEYLYLFAKYPEYISDRGLIDVVGYTKWMMERGQASQSCYEKQMWILKDWLYKHPDVFHVYFPVVFPMVDDGYRDTDEANRLAVDRCITEVIDELKECGAMKAIFTITSGPVDKRVKEIVNLAKVLATKA